MVCAAKCKIAKAHEMILSAVPPENPLR